MLDIKKIIQDPNLFKLSLQARGVNNTLIDEAIELYTTKKELIHKSETNKKELNSLAKKIQPLKKKESTLSPEEKDTLSKLLTKVSSLKQENIDIGLSLDKVEAKLIAILLHLPNTLDKTVPFGEGEEDNVLVSTEGTLPNFSFEVKDHVQLGEELDILDFEKAAQVSGARFVFYKKDLARLERALINFFLDELNTQNYQEIIPPVLVHQKALVGTGQLPKFEQDLFKVSNNHYLIPTAEVPLTNLKREELFGKEELPLKYCAVTPCFRSEAGAHGKDTKGLIRMHQFNKVEMVQITEENDSEAAHEQMVKSAENLLQKLKLPFRKILLCSKDIGFSAKKCFDIEVWIPSQNKYREISSISNCGDFQARRAMIRYRNEEGKPTFAHTLNGSALAVGRTVVAIMENYQQEDGSITIPEVLVPYMGGQTVIKK